MIRYLKNFALAVAVFAASLSVSSLPSKAANDDYRFEVIDQPIKSGKEATFAVRLQTSAGKPVTATITEQKLHMVMGSMDMPSPVKLLSSDKDGTHHFGAALTMYGEWTLDLTASIAGEKNPINSEVKFKVVK